MNAFEHDLAIVYPSLSAKLREAADFVVANPVEVATRSLRAVSSEAGLAPATFSRMARAVGYETYEDVRETMRVSVSDRAGKFADGVERLQSDGFDPEESFVSKHLKACVSNLQSLGLKIDEATFNGVVKRLNTSRQVHVLGVMGSTGIAEHMSYTANFIADNWHLAGRMGASLGSTLVGLGQKDVLIVITMPPFANRSINAAKEAKAQGVYVLVITDTYACPALTYASASFITPTDSPHFFSSYVSTLALVEALIGVLAAESGEAALKRIAQVETSNSQLEYY